ncbi:outer membrane protein [Rufibacter radiotolerans]|uniref:Outer membrane protein n=1 Tax=Rufibacter radiotolerans TaxID=1379910 RepID=A0A0H4VPR3_9BACT|nr:porin [Rufibacter radiotolerans]AKQ45922.1 outer membrane protein [Rufibacter radiotolerans]
MKIFTTLVLLLAISPAFAQTDSTRQITLSGFLDAYYSYDFHNPALHERPAFLYNHNRHNEFNINLAFLKAAYATDKVRGNLALMSGTYAQYNLAVEHELLRHLFEANVGVRLLPRVWLDAGVFPSHIGAESAISRDNLTLSRSLGAENTPYYETGAKLTFAVSEKLSLTGLVLNGWQNIHEAEGNQNKALGTQITYKPSAKVTLNSSTFFGNEKPDNARQRRYFHNFYASLAPTTQWSLIASFDYGLEQKPYGERGYNRWWNPTLALKYQALPKLGIAARAEYYHDRHGVIIGTATANGFQTAGYSLNLDYAPAQQVLWRVEARLLDSKDAIFTKESGSATHKNTALSTSLSFSF